MAIATRPAETEPKAREPFEPLEIARDHCKGCGLCVDVCPGHDRKFVWSSASSVFDPHEEDRLAIHERRPRVEAAAGPVREIIDGDDRAGREPAEQFHAGDHPTASAGVLVSPRGAT